MELPTNSKCSWWRLDGHETHSTDTAKDMELDDGDSDSDTMVSDFPDSEDESK